MHPGLLALFFVVGGIAAYLASRGDDVAGDASGGDAATDVVGGYVDMAAPDLSAIGAQLDNGLDDGLPLMPSRKIFDIPPEGAAYADAIKQAEVRYGLPESLLARVIYQESRYRQDIISGKVRSSVGAVGIAQFMPATAKEFGINPLDPFASIDAAAKYLRSNFNLLGDWVKAVAGYNWGQGNVMRQGLAAAPLETRNYIKEIFADVSV